VPSDLRNAKATSRMKADLRVTAGTRRGERCTFMFEDMRIDAYQGETIAAALLASGRREFRRDSLQRPRGPYCNMGTCFECVVEVRSESSDGGPFTWRVVRACLVAVADGLTVRSVTLPLDRATP